MAKKKRKKKAATGLEKFLADSGAGTVEVKQVALKDLKVDPSYQRNPTQKRVDGIAADFNPVMAGTLVVNRRNGTKKLHVIDGNHRVRAMKKCGIKEWSALVTTGLSAKGEARIWRLCNSNRTPATVYERFRARLVERDPVAVDIERIVTKHGMDLLLYKERGNREPNDLACIAALETIYKKKNGPQVLDRTLGVLSGAWLGDTSMHWCGHRLVRGVASALSVARWKIDDERLIGLLKTQDATRVDSQIGTLAKLDNMLIAYAGREIIRRIYNKNIRAGSKAYLSDRRKG